MLNQQISCLAGGIKMVSVIKMTATHSTTHLVRLEANIPIEIESQSFQLPVLADPKAVNPEAQAEDLIF